MNFGLLLKEFQAFSAREGKVYEVEVSLKSLVEIEKELLR